MGRLGLHFTTNHKPFDLAEARGLTRTIVEPEAGPAPGNRPFARFLAWTSYFLLVFTAMTSFDTLANAGSLPVPVPAPMHSDARSPSPDALHASGGSVQETPTLPVFRLRGTR